MYLTVGNAIDPETQEARPVPQEFMDYILRSKIYFCTPEELDRQDYETAMLDYRLWNTEREAEQMRNQQ